MYRDIFTAEGMYDNVQVSVSVDLYLPYHVYWCLLQTVAILLLSDFFY